MKEQYPPLSIEQISPEDWEKTPEGVQTLIESLLARVMQYEALVEQDRTECRPRAVKGQQALLEDGNPYQQVVETQTDFILRSQPDTTITFANESLCLALGCSLEQIIGQKWIDFGNPEDLENILQQISELTPENPSFLAENRDHRADGQTGWTQWINQGIFGAQGQLVQIQSVGRDITALKQVEAALRESEARFQNIAANLPGAIFRYLLRPDGSDAVLYMSPGCYRLWEVEAQEVEKSAKVLWDMVHPDDVAAMYESVMVATSTLQPWSWKWRITTPSGKTKWLQATGSPRRDERGNVISDTLILDVSEQHAALMERERVEIELQNTRNFLQIIINHLPVAVFVKDGRAEHFGKTLLWNQTSELIFGFTAEQSLGKTVHDHWPKEQADFFEQKDREAFERGVPEDIPEETISSPTLGNRILHTVKVPLYDCDRSPLYLLCFSEDITNRKLAEVALRESEERYRFLAENINDLVCLHQPDGQYIYVSPSCESLLGYCDHELIGASPYSFFHPEDRDRIIEEAHKTALAEKPVSITYRMRQKSGNYIWLETLTKPIVEAGRVVQLQTTSRDVTERIQVQDRLRHDALHDALTGLPNRNLLMERLELAMNRAKRLENYHFAVLFLDLDRFKVINDSLGHLVGDQLLISIAHKLQSILRATDLAVRLGGDEFVILLDEIKHIQEAVRATERIFAELRVPLIIEGREVHTTTSIGIVLDSKGYREPAHMLRDADIAMYRAKTKGRGKYEIFDTEMHVQAIRRLHLENDLRQAIARQEFVLYYQPIIALDTRDVVGFEALVHWQHPTLGWMSAGEFIAIAEETGLITLLDYWVLYTACAQLAAWQTAFPDRAAIKVSVNLSVQDLRRPDLLEEVDRVLTQTGLEGRSLILEITESMLIEDAETTITLLGRLKERGIEISIDDFGTGYSSLSYLHRLPVNHLKVDRSFVNQMQSGRRNHEIVETIMALSDRLELEAIAEGIETQQQLEWLQQLGCKWGQGYLFSKSLSSKAAEALLATRNCQENVQR